MEVQSASVWYSLSRTPGLGPKRLAMIALAANEAGLQGADLPALAPADIERLGLRSNISQKVVDALESLTSPPDAGHATLTTPDHPKFPWNRLRGPIPVPVPSMRWAT